MLQFDGNNLSQTFYLRSQVEPVDETLYANIKDKVSKLRADHALYLYKPEEEEQKGANPQLSKSLVSKIGGVAGIGSSEARSTISLEKLRF